MILRGRIRLHIFFRSAHTIIDHITLNHKHVDFLDNKFMLSRAYEKGDESNLPQFWPYRQRVWDRYLDLEN